MDSHSRYAAWRELHREPAMQFRALCQKHLTPDQIAEIDRRMTGAHGHALFWRWWSELRAAAPQEAQTVCPMDHQEIIEDGSGYCTCCHLTIMPVPAPTKKAKQPSAKQSTLQLALEI